MPDHAPDLPRSRFWLFVPFLVFGLVAAGWITTWFVIRDRTSQAIDGWVANEALLGRQWACPGRSIGGFPFRIEVTCDSLTLQRPDFRLTLGRMTALAQVYRPRHVIAQVAGPLRATDSAIGLEGAWRHLEASIRTAPEGLQRVSLVAENPMFRLIGLGPANIDLGAEHLETHLRPNPDRAAEGAYDWSAQAAKLAVPGLDALIGGTEPADLDLQLTATQARDLAARPLADELERWRQAGGRIELTRFGLTKGTRRIEGKGQFGLDEAHRPEGRADLAAAGLEGVLGGLLGARTGATAALLGALIGRPAAPEPVPDATNSHWGMRPLPPLRLEGGRIQLGPFPIPGIRVAPLY